jgi:hypothetical protein
LSTFVVLASDSAGEVFNGLQASPSSDGPSLFETSSAETLARALGISDAFHMMETVALLIDRYGRVRTNKVADNKLGDHHIVDGHLITETLRRHSANSLSAARSLNGDAGTHGAARQDEQDSGCSRPK